MYIIRSVNNMSQPRENSTAQRFFFTFMARIPHPIGGGQCIGRRHWERTVAEEVSQRLRGAARGTVLMSWCLCGTLKTKQKHR